MKHQMREKDFILNVNASRAAGIFSKQDYEKFQ